jgi:hypothetical protein
MKSVELSCCPGGSSRIVYRVCPRRGRGRLRRGREFVGRGGSVADLHGEWHSGPTVSGSAGERQAGEEEGRDAAGARASRIG